ncbi:hypothetical protein C8Q73DRAFT_224240 [Cubamyces lactineus]|nr:hypothetical protein C8Q73DRAFT_224240 [Cubamyces lactineus]
MNEPPRQLVQPLPPAPESSFGDFDVDIASPSLILRLGQRVARVPCVPMASSCIEVAGRAGRAVSVPLVEMLLPDARGSPENSLPWVPTLARSPVAPSPQSRRRSSSSVPAPAPGVRATGPRIAHICIEFYINSGSGRETYQCSAVGGTGLLGIRRRTYGTWCADSSFAMTPQALALDSFRSVHARRTTQISARRYIGPMASYLATIPTTRSRRAPHPERTYNCAVSWGATARTAGILRPDIPRCPRRTACAAQQCARGCCTAAACGPLS